MQLKSVILTLRWGSSIPLALHTPQVVSAILCHCLSLHSISLGKENGYTLVLHVSKGTQDFTHSLIFENGGISKYLEALSWNAKTEQQDFLASGAGKGKFGSLVGYYLLGINTERVYAKAEGTMPSSQNKTLTAT